MTTFNFFNDFFERLGKKEIDLNGDTLLYAGQLTAGLNSNIFTLFRNKLEFNEITLDKARINIRRPEGQADNNLQFILDYFSSPQPKQNGQATPKGEPGRNKQQKPRPTAPRISASSRGLRGTGCGSATRTRPAG